jgi:hypothetical protein
MQQLLEPKFINLVNRDEQKLIMLWAIAKWLLKFEELIYFQV